MAESNNNCTYFGTSYHVRLIVESNSDKLLDNPRTSRTHCQVWFIWGAWNTSRSSKALERSYYNFLVGINSLLKWYNLLYQFDCTTSLKQSDWSVKLYPATIFKKSYWTIQISSSTYLKQYYWIVQFYPNTFLEKTYWINFLIVKPSLRILIGSLIWTDFRFWTNFKITTEIQNLDQFSNFLPYQPT